jgi:hypothetical protein
MQNEHAECHKGSYVLATSGSKPTGKNSVVTDAKDPRASEITASHTPPFLSDVSTELW